MAEPTLAGMLQDFFLKRLMSQRNASPHTIASYRDTFRLLLQHVNAQTHKRPCSLTMEDLDARAILDFLDHVETDRHNAASSRNVRLSAIRSFFRYCAYQAPGSMAAIQKVLSIPTKRTTRRDVGFLSIEEMQAIIGAPDLSTWSGMRDHTMFATLYNTGARVSEITGMKIMDLSLSTPSARIHGKGRKERIMPLWQSTVKLLKSWLKCLDADPGHPLFPSARGKPMTRHGVEYRLGIAKKSAEAQCPSLKEKRVSPHSIRHTTAIHLLQSGIDISVIALWLGHESPVTTHHYLQADLAMKKRILEKLDPPRTNSILFKPGDTLLRFLESL
ncbi:MAG: tyrosine-type recombinase/integrase [Candidatus Latescibacterota bacterium]